MCRRGVQILTAATFLIQELEAAAATAIAAKDQAVKDRAVLEENTDTLRALVVEYMGGPTPAVRQQSDRERRFWEELATPGLLAASEPPADYLADEENELATTVDPVRAVQVEAMRAGLIRARADAKALRNEVERLRTSRDAVRAAHITGKKEARQLALRQQAHLVGAVRRIAYLVSERTRQRAQLRAKDAYVARLESKLLDQIRAHAARPSSERAALRQLLAEDGNGGGDTKKKKRTKHGRKEPPPVPVRIPQPPPSAPSPSPAEASGDMGELAAMMAQLQAQSQQQTAGGGDRTEQQMVDGKGFADSSGDFAWPRSDAEAAAVFDGVADDPDAVPLSSLGEQERSLLATFMAESGVEAAANYDPDEIEGFESQLQRIGATNSLGGTPSKYTVFSSER